MARLTALLRGAGWLALGLALAGPLAALALHALSERWFYPQLLPAEWTAAPLLRRLASPETQSALDESLRTAGATTLASLLIGLPAARALGLRRFRGRGLALAALFLPSVLPPLAIGIGLNVLLLRLGLAGAPPAVVLAHLAVVAPYTIFALLGVFARYDEGYELQARTLGLSPAQVWLRVTLPLAGPGIAVAALFAFLVSWSQYLLTLLAGGGRVITLPILLFTAVSGGSASSIAALALLFAAPPLAAIGLAARALSSGSASVGQQY